MAHRPAATLEGRPRRAPYRGDPKRRGGAAERWRACTMSYDAPPPPMALPRGLPRKALPGMANPRTTHRSQPPDCRFLTNFDARALKIDDLDFLGVQGLAEKSAAHA